jgi:hypothetical protein
VGRIRIQRRRDVHQHAIARAATAEFQVSERGGGQFLGAMRPQIFFGDTAEIRGEEFPGEHAPRLRHALQRVRDYLFDERETGSRNLAEHVKFSQEGMRARRIRARDYTCGDASSWRVRRAEFDGAP